MVRFWALTANNQREGAKLRSGRKTNGSEFY